MKLPKGKFINNKHLFNVVLNVQSPNDDEQVQKRQWSKVMIKYLLRFHSHINKDIKRAVMSNQRGHWQFISKSRKCSVSYTVVKYQTIIIYLCLTRKYNDFEWYKRNISNGWNEILYFLWEIYTCFPYIETEDDRRGTRMCIN